MEAIPVEILAKQVACSLDASAVPERAEEWTALLARATTRERDGDAVTFRFPTSDGMASAIADLAQREVDCCAFFAFAIRIAGGEVTLEVRAPAEAAPLLDALFER